jgi:GDP-4-dehydro-6-deoxy-D-mannose reductase
MKRVLITGASGFVGQHLSRHLLGLGGIEVFGMRRKSSSQKCVPGVFEFHADILDASSVRKAFRKIKPHRVYHLAGQSSVAESWRDPRKTFRVNVDGTRNLLEAALGEKIAPRIHIAGSAEEYGSQAGNRRLLSELSPLRPVNPYAVSKIAQEFLAVQYALSKKLSIVCTRAFNHFGPGQSDRFVASSFAKQFALIMLGLKKPWIEVGNLKAVRDFTDVRDVVRAYHRVLEKGKSGEVYNVSTGNPREIRDILRFYLRGASVKIKVLSTPARSRTVDASFLVGNARKLQKLTGWRPRIQFEETLCDLLDHWKERILREKK